MVLGLHPCLCPLPLPMLYPPPAGNDLERWVQEGRKDNPKQSKLRLPAPKADLPQQAPSTQRLHSRAPATALGSAFTGGFPGFSVLPLPQSTAAAGLTDTGKPILRRGTGSHYSSSTEAGFPPPAVSPEPALHCRSSAGETHVSNLTTFISIISAYAGTWDAHATYSCWACINLVIRL